MRPIIFLSALLLGFASCKKDYRCSCPAHAQPPDDTIYYNVEAKNEGDALVKCTEKDNSATCFIVQNR